MFWTGLHTGEAVGLRRGDLDLRRDQLHVRRSRTLREDNPPKTKRSHRTVTLVPAVAAVLRAMQAPLHVTDEVFVFTTTVGTSLDAPGISLKRLADYCGTSVEMIERHYGRHMHGDTGRLTLLAGSSSRSVDAAPPAAAAVARDAAVGGETFAETFGDRSRPPTRNVSKIT